MPVPTSASIEDGPADQQAFCDIVDEMTRSINSAKESIKSLSSQEDFDTKDGISLLSLKHHVLLSYIQSLILLSSHRIIGHTLSDRSSPSGSFSDLKRSARGANAGDAIDSMIEDRIVLEKIKALEGKMRYQIEKLVKLAAEPVSEEKDVLNDPLVFRPNLQNLMDPASASENYSDDDEDQDKLDGDRRDGIYRPPKIAPMPYNEGPREKKKRRAPIANGLSELTPYEPHVESTSGLGSVPSLQSARAKEIQRMTEFEEENFTRLVMKKKDAKRRRQDEADIALGGNLAGVDSLTGRRRGKGIGLESEFADILKSVNRKSSGAVGDGYEELRQRGKKSDVLARSRMKSRVEIEADDGGDTRERKKGRFEKQQRAFGKRINRKTKR